MIEAAIWMARWRPGRSNMTGTQVHCRSLHAITIVEPAENERNDQRLEDSGRYLSSDTAELS